MQGYIKLHRSILDNTIFKCKPFSKGQAWITLLLLTNHKEGYINVKNGELIKIERGECGYSELALADLFGWSRGKVKRFLELLKSEKMIHQKIVANRTIISIINYDNYQNDTVNSTVNGHLTVHQTDINNNDKNDNNEKNDNTHINDAKTKRLEKKECVCVDLTEKEKKILKSYARKSNANNVDAYIYSLVKNGSYKEIIENANDREKVKELPPKIEIVKEEPEVTEQAFLKFKKKLKEIKRSKINEKGNSMAETLKIARG